MKRIHWILALIIIALGGAIFNIDWLTASGIGISILVAVIPFIKVYIARRND